MLRFGLIWGLFLFLVGMNAQECPNLIQPLQGSTNVPVDTTISWEEVLGVTGYIISIGTTPGGGDIVNEQPTGSDTNFIPPLGLPESTLIYVRITLFFFDQDNIICNPQSFTTENVTEAPECTQLLAPENGETGVNVATNLGWEYASRATGYRLSLGTTLGGTEILNDFDVGNVLGFNPAVNFPPETTIYTSIIPYNENGQALGCMEESFTTASLGEPPACTYLVNPVDGEINVPLSPVLEWAAVPGATGYSVYIGKTPFINDILDGATFSTNSTLVLNFEPNNTYFVRIIPFNEAGQAQDCIQESFSTILGCGPVYDPDTGELIDFYPVSTFPDTVGICENNLPTRFYTPDVADGYRWFEVLPSGSESLISEENYADFFQTGLYRYEVYNVVIQEGTPLECSYSKEFQVSASSIASIENIVKELNGFTFTILAEVSGGGMYEYSLDGENFQDAPEFTNLTQGYYTLYVRDKGGCGVVEEKFQLAYPPTGFPPYFSPNGDGYNDYWNYIRPLLNPLSIERIYIYDRYGKVLAIIGPAMEGWDGNYNNLPMPSDGYWYRAQTSEGTEIKGFFSLVR